MVSKMREEKRIQTLRLLNLNKLMKKTDTAFQLRRRLESANKQGVVRCVTCNAFGFYNRGFNGGHFIPRQHKGTRYAAINVNPQCVRCNKHLGGNYAKYEDWLVSKVGVDAVADLKREKDLIPAMGWREFCISILLESEKINKELKKLYEK